MDGCNAVNFNTKTRGCCFKTCDGEPERSDFQTTRDGHDFESHYFQGCGSDGWTCVDVPRDGSYGSKEIEIPALQSWVNTGLFLKAGDSANITISGGTWGYGFDNLVAQIGLQWADRQSPVATISEGTKTIKRPRTAYSTWLCSVSMNSRLRKGMLQESRGCVL